MAHMVPGKPDIVGDSRTFEIVKSQIQIALKSIVIVVKKVEVYPLPEPKSDHQRVGKVELYGHKNSKYWKSSEIRKQLNGEARKRGEIC